MSTETKPVKFGTAPVFFTAISTILGAILFLRFGFSVGTLGFIGTIGVILLGHLVTIPTALAISELATNEKVEGGGEYFIISRSFGLNIGSTIGIALFFSQAISTAFYVIAFTEAFAPLFDWVNQTIGWNMPRQVISLPAMLGLSVLIFTKGADLGVKALYIVVGILLVSLGLFFVGQPEYAQTASPNFFSLTNTGNFWVVFAIIFPAFTGMTAGVGLSGDLKDPKKSIPIGTVAATLSGMIIYIFIAWKLFASASPEALSNTENLVMADIALWGFVVIPIGLAASTISSAIGSILVAPRTLQALAVDRTFPVRRLNVMLAMGKGKNKEPKIATLITCAIAFVFVAWGEVDAVAQIISMFFMVTYGSICLISFLYHFGADPSYRPSFRSHWAFSLLGFLMSVFCMFQISLMYTILATIVMAVIYVVVGYYHKDRKGMQAIFQGAYFQLSRQIQVSLQRAKKSAESEKWRPSVVCISKNSFERQNIHRVLSWISYRYGFASFIHLMEDYFSTQSNEQSKELQDKLIEQYVLNEKSNVYIDTLISPSYTSAIAQVIQLPGISGKENNMMMFEYNKNQPQALEEIVQNYPLAKAGDMDVCIFGTTDEQIVPAKGIHVWISPKDVKEANLMILLSYIILGHPFWKKGHIKLFNIIDESSREEQEQEMAQLVENGRLPISSRNIEFIVRQDERSVKSYVNEYSKDAGMAIIGYRAEQIKHVGKELFEGYEDVKHMLFVNAFNEKQI